MLHHGDCLRSFFCYAIWASCERDAKRMLVYNRLLSAFSWARSCSFCFHSIHLRFVRNEGLPKLGKSDENNA